jgi:hypothetical protein
MHVFRSDASTREKIYTIGTLVWMALLVAGYVYGEWIHFSADPGRVGVLLGAALPIAFVHWLPLYGDRHPSNLVPGFPPLRRFAAYSGAFIASFTLAMGTFLWLAGPLTTGLFGSPISAELVVTRVSDGGARYRSCDHFVMLKDRASGWRDKVCLSVPFWQTVHVGQVLIGTGRQTVFGRTVEDLSPRSE